jgi:hypothetical protein
MPSCPVRCIQMFGSHAKRHRKNHPGMFASGLANPRAAVAAAPATSGAASEAAATTSPIDYVPADAEAPASLARHLNQTVAVAASGPVSGAASTASLTGSFPAGAVVPELLARHWNQTFHGRNRQAKAAAALLQSTAAAAATASVATSSAPNGVTGIGVLVSTLTGTRRADVGSGSFAAAAASAGRNATASFSGTVNPLVRSSVQESASAASASRSVPRPRPRPHCPAFCRRPDTSGLHSPTRVASTCPSPRTMRPAPRAGSARQCSISTRLRDAVRSTCTRRKTVSVNTERSSVAAKSERKQMMPTRRRLRRYVSIHDAFVLHAVLRLMNLVSFGSRALFLSGTRRLECRLQTRNGAQASTRVALGLL